MLGPLETGVTPDLTWCRMGCQLHVNFHVSENSLVGDGNTPQHSNARRCERARSMAVMVRDRLLIVALVLLPAALSLKLSRPPGLRAAPVVMREPRRAAPSVLERASGLLGRLAADAFNRTMALDPDQPVPTKRFVFSATVRHVRDIKGPLGQYMRLPIEDYALYDARLMKRVDSDTFELSLPLKSYTAGSEPIKPTLRVRVIPDPERNSLRIQSIGASLYGLSNGSSGGGSRNGSLFSRLAIVEEQPAATLSAPRADGSAQSYGSGGDSGSSSSSGSGGGGGGGSGSSSLVDSSSLVGTPEGAARTAYNNRRLISGLEEGLRSADLGFNTTLTWRGGVSRSRSGERGSFTRLGTTVQAQLSVVLPPPFTAAPRLIVQGAAGVVMRSIMQLVVPQFVNLLEADFQRWVNGSARDMAGLNGTLMEETSVLEAVDAAAGDAESPNN